MKPSDSLEEEGRSRKPERASSSDPRERLSAPLIPSQFQNGITIFYKGKKKGEPFETSAMFVRPNRCHEPVSAEGDREHND